jgi:hypothetical protein
MEWWVTSTVWNITVSGISVNIVTILRLDHIWFVSRSKRLTFYPEYRTSPWHIWPAVWWMLWIFPQHWSSWCIRLITYLYFLLRLQMSAVVTVLMVNVFMVYTGTALTFIVNLGEWLQYVLNPSSCTTVIWQFFPSSYWIYFSDSVFPSSVI